MMTAKLKKVVLGLLTVAFLTGGAMGCERLPTDVASSDESDGCIMLNGMLQCPD